VGGFVAICLAALSLDINSQSKKFYDDDPLAREPETQDASQAQGWKNVLAFDLMLNLFAPPGDLRNQRALNVNTIDEVPDSSWFTNRILAQPLSIEAAVRGPVVNPGPAPGPMTVYKAKPAGVTPGFRLLDSAGVEWFVQFDAPGQLGAASGASIVANRIFHALGYWQVEQHIAEIRPEALSIGPKATTETPSGKIRQLDRDDMAKLFARAARQPNGAYRVLAGRRLPGKGLGGFRYYGTRPDDPNDVVPHEHRRELRALRVFGAWVNLVDMKAGNTLDMIVDDGGRGVVRHYLQDVGSTFGTGALAPREWDEGYEHLYEGDATWKRLLTFGLYLRPWQTVRYRYHPEVGRFEGDRFDPTAWKPRVPTAAFLNARADDNFWAARRVMAFSDDMLRAIVKTAHFSDAAAEEHLVNVLIKRRDQIGRAYLTAVNPIVKVVLDSAGTLTFENAAVEAKVADPPQGGYRAEWALFDNTTGESRPLGVPASSMTGRMTAPVRLPESPGTFIRVQIVSVDPARQSWNLPVDAYFRRASDGWKLVGLERRP
jgi:hypothetical protein